jgi:hypothetical protein
MNNPFSNPVAIAIRQLATRTANYIPPAVSRSYKRIG